MKKLDVFKGSDKYVVTQELMNAVNVSIALEKPLLIKGEPGTGKTMLAEAIADALDMKLLIWGIKSTTKAQEGLYVYDTVQRLYDSQFGEGDVANIKQYIKLGKLGEAFPNAEKMEEIIKVHFGDIDRKLCQKALEAFYEIRNMKEIQKKPSTSELLDWLQALMISGVSVNKIKDEIPFVGVLLKKNQDIDIMHEIKEKGYSLKRW